jgi:hypothetical protein
MPQDAMLANKDEEGLWKKLLDFQLRAMPNIFLFTVLKYFSYLLFFLFSCYKPMTEFLKIHHMNSLK